MQVENWVFVVCLEFEVVGEVSVDCIVGEMVGVGAIDVGGGVNDVRAEVLVAARDKHISKIS